MGENFPYKGLIPRIYRELPKLSNKIKTKQTKEKPNLIDQDLNRHFSKRRFRNGLSPH